MPAPGADGVCTAPNGLGLALALRLPTAKPAELYPSGPVAFNQWLFKQQVFH